MAAKTCEICKTRPAQTTTQALRDFGTVFPYCYPCHELAEQENVHSDDGHDESAPFDGCWVCHPELDQTSAEYTPRSGTSRAGMTINVPIRAAGATKAKVTAEKLSAPDAKARTSKGVTTLRSKSLDLVLNWDQGGRFVGGTVAGRKVRNVAEALRVAKA